MQWKNKEGFVWTKISFDLGNNEGYKPSDLGGRPIVVVSEWNEVLALWENFKTPICVICVGENGSNGQYFAVFSVDITFVSHFVAPTSPTLNYDCAWKLDFIKPGHKYVKCTVNMCSYHTRHSFASCNDFY